MENNILPKEQVYTLLQFIYQGIIIIGWKRTNILSVKIVFNIQTTLSGLHYSFSVNNYNYSILKELLVWYSFSNN